MEKLKNLKAKMNLESNKLPEKELNFLTGGCAAIARAGGSGSGSSKGQGGIPTCLCCDGTITTCSPPPPM